MFGWFIEIPVENVSALAQDLSNKSATSLTGSASLGFCRFCHETTDVKR